MVALVPFRGLLTATDRHGEIVLRTCNQHGNIDRHVLWWTEANNFLSVNVPECVEQFGSVAKKYNDQLLVDPYGRAVYNLIQEQLEVLKRAKGIDTIDRWKNGPGIQ